MNSDWEKLRRFAMQLFPAGYAERWVIGAAPDTVGAEEFARHTETLPRGWGLPRTLYQDLYQKLTARK